MGQLSEERRPRSLVPRSRKVQPSQVTFMVEPRDSTEGRHGVATESHSPRWNSS